MAQNKNIKNDKTNNNTNLYEFYINKLEYYKDIVLNITFDLDVKIKSKYITTSESIQCINECRNIYEEIINCYHLLESKNTKSKNSKNLHLYLQDNIPKLQVINDILNKVIKLYGCYNVDYLISICFGNDYVSKLKDNVLYDKQLLLNKYFHSTSFKCFVWKDDEKNNTYLIKNKIVEDHHIVQSGNTFECFDLSRTTSSYDQKINGMKVCYQNTELKRTLIITGYVDVNVDIKCVDNRFIVNLKTALLKSKAMDINVNDENYKNYIAMLSLKECLVYSTKEINKNYIGIMNQYDLIKSKQMVQVVNEFMNMEIIMQMKFIKNLLIHHHEPNSYYLCGILFSLLNEDNSGNIISTLQNKIYRSLPFECQLHLHKLKMSSSKTSLYTKFNTNKIPYEQQIEMMSVSDEIKEKAYSKLKDVMSKSDESGSKARNYLDGLLKIPFGIYKEEPILKSKETLNFLFKNICKNLNIFNDVITKENSQYSNCDLKENKVLNRYLQLDGCASVNDIRNICNHLNKHIVEQLKNILREKGKKYSRFEVKKTIDDYNLSVKSIKLKSKSAIIKNLKRATTTGKKKNEMMATFLEIFINNLVTIEDYNCVDSLEKLITPVSFEKETSQLLNTIFSDVSQLKSSFEDINEKRKMSLENIDTCVYGHTNAKTQIKNIINQWITGEQSGYCFGFEGPPGIGKTSMAKTGLSKCLEDHDGFFRPFEFIAIGGSTNGSYLNGHSYTYLGSSWGRIVDILISKKCMNPIIFIDELDKVSNSEHGKEITGILTHLIDATQNTGFQDKYFTGIDIDLSKALFIFSYNDPSKVDSILLDRIHRIKFDKLTPYDKLVICNNYLIPEMNKKYGFNDDFIIIDDKTILFLIDGYTYESGVRKLKQLLFEIWGEINEMLLNNNITTKTYVLDNDVIETNLLKNRIKMLTTSIPKTPDVGMINGLWANNLGLGGLTPIQVKWYPCKTPLELKLTGMQGDVMKESMNVAKTVAWNLLSKKELDMVWGRVYNENGVCYGIHIHCPEGAVNKDGPSAGGAITSCLLSLFKNKTIDNSFAMTGEINLSGSITAIGGLEHKLYYGICAGAKTFAFPYDNIRDFELFKERYSDKIKSFNEIKFYPVKSFQDVYEIIF